jgi:hypothetical protein
MAISRDTESFPDGEWILFGKNLDLFARHAKRLNRISQSKSGTQITGHPATSTQATVRDPFCAGSRIGRVSSSAGMFRRR